jgi:putative addiction module component (TIGR02574 family)
LSITVVDGAEKARGYNWLSGPPKIRAISISMSTPEEIYAAANALPPNDRWMLVTRLWETLPPEAWEAPDDHERAEIQRRSAEFDAGGVEPIEKAEVQQRIRKFLASDC